MFKLYKGLFYVGEFRSKRSAINFVKRRKKLKGVFTVVSKDTRFSWYKPQFLD